MIHRRLIPALCRFTQSTIDPVTWRERMVITIACRTSDRGGLPRLDNAKTRNDPQIFMHMSAIFLISSRIIATTIHFCAIMILTSYTPPSMPHGIAEQIG
jgi:hypothetical protein